MLDSRHLKPVADVLSVPFLPPLASSLLMASSLPLHLPSSSSYLFLGFRSSLQPHSIPFQTRRDPNPRLKSPISASSSSSSSSWEREEPRWLREEQRWIREEQRWIREEQRWIREESRWNSEREALLLEIAALKLRIEALEREKSSTSSSISDAVSNLASILQALKDSESKSKSAPGRIAESGSGPRPMLSEEGEVKEMVLEETKAAKSGVEVKKKVTLRKGSEGEDVRAMQVCVLGS